MGFDFLRVAAMVPKVNVADCEYNVASVISCAKEACEKGAKVLLCPELSVTGYTCGDLFAQSALQRRAVEGLCEIKAATARLDCMLVVGAPLKVGALLYDCAVVMSKGEFVGVVPKRYLTPMEHRVFACELDCANRFVKIGNDEVLLGVDLLFTQDDVRIAIEFGDEMSTPKNYAANVVLRMSASHEEMGKYETVKEDVRTASRSGIAGYVYVSAGYGESTTDYVYGGKAFVAENGELLVSSGAIFDESGDVFVADIDVELVDAVRGKNNVFAQCVAESAQACFEVAIEGFDIKTDCTEEVLRMVDPQPFIPMMEETSSKCEEAIAIQIAGLRRRLEFTNIKNVVLGVSGGLDSTLALLVCNMVFERLGYDKKGIVGITMPGFGTTDRTYNNALELMTELGITQKEIPIKKSVLQHFEDIGHDVNVKDVTYENSQARERTQILMDYANRCNGLVLGTGDLSELALGWATYNGDHMSMYGVNAGIPKTLVKELVRWFAMTSGNEKVSEILYDIVDTPISPELMPADDKGEIKQKTEDLVGPYELHDFFIYNVMYYGFAPEKVYNLARVAFEGEYDDEIIKKWLKTFYRRFFMQQFKRSCLPDGPKVVSVGLSPRGGWNMPSDASVRMWLAECEKL